MNNAQLLLLDTIVGFPSATPRKETNTAHYFSGFTLSLPDGCKGTYFILSFKIILTFIQYGMTLYDGI